MTELRPRESAAVETDKGNPFRLSAFQAEPPQGLFSIMKMLESSRPASHLPEGNFILALVCMLCLLAGAVGGFIALILFQAAAGAD